MGTHFSIYSSSFEFASFAVAAAVVAFAAIVALAMPVGRDKELQRDHVLIRVQK
jgi:hypothetical protein